MHGHPRALPTSGPVTLSHLPPTMCQCSLITASLESLCWTLEHLWKSTQEIRHSACPWEGALWFAFFFFFHSTFLTLHKHIYFLLKHKLKYKKKTKETRQEHYLGKSMPLWKCPQPSQIIFPLFFIYFQIFPSRTEKTNQHLCETFILAHERLYIYMEIKSFYFFLSFIFIYSEREHARMCPNWGQAERESQAASA